MPPAKADVALTVETGPAPRADHILFGWGGRYGLTLGSCGSDWLMASALDGAFLIEPGRHRVRCFVERPNEPAWLDVLVRRVLPRVAMLYGATAVHAATAAIDGGALMLLGGSGAGKSTLSASLGANGWDILSDDISIIWEPGAPVVTPSTTGVCVWEDSRVGLELPDPLCVPMPGYEGKVRFAPGGEQDGGAVPLKALIFLARLPNIEMPELRPLPAGEGLIRASRQRIRFNPADANRETVDTFGRLGEIARVTPCYGLRYPADYGALPQVAELLRGILRA
ncbi:hypothetical protein OF829_13450 [Sphingomonas sp. LB-2]|nr:hypothetical protein [Sphingomonas caeni]